MYIGSLIDFDRSILMYPDQWTKIQKQIHVLNTRMDKCLFLNFFLS